MKLLAPVVLYSFVSLSLQLDSKDVCKPKLDLMLLLDTSGSIEEIYDEHIKWTEAIVDSLPVDNGSVRVAAIQYAASPKTEFTLNKFNTKKKVIEQLREMSFRSGVTRTGAALSHAENELFRSDRGARNDATKMIIVFTDGLSIDDPLRIAERLRAERNVKIYVVSVSTNGFVPEMQRIAGSIIGVFGPEELDRLLVQLNRDMTNSTTCEKPKIAASKTVTLSRPINSSPTTTAKTFPTLVTMETLSEQMSILPTQTSGPPKTLYWKSKATAKKPSTTLTIQSTSNSTGPTKPKKRYRKVIKRVRKIRKEAKRNNLHSASVPMSTKKLHSGSTKPTKATNAKITTPSGERQAISSTTIMPSTKKQSLHDNNESSLHDAEFSKTARSHKAFGVSNLATSGDLCPMDVVFIVDSSASVGGSYEKQKEFLSTILTDINPTESLHRVALIQFAGKAHQRVEWTFESYDENKSIMKAFKNVRYFSGTTYIGAALQSALNLLETRRKDGVTLVVLVSDGFSQDDATRPAAAIRALNNVDLLAVSLSDNSNVNYLRLLTADSKKIFVGEDVAHLKDRLLSRINCQE